jgi:hypothetical protein
MNRDFEAPHALSLIDLHSQTPSRTRSRRTKAARAAESPSSTTAPRRQRGRSDARLPREAARSRPGLSAERRDGSLANARDQGGRSADEATAAAANVVLDLVLTSAHLAVPQRTGAGPKRRSSPQMGLVRQTFKNRWGLVAPGWVGSTPAPLRWTKGRGARAASLGMAEALVPLSPRGALGARTRGAARTSTASGFDTLDAG